MKRFILLAALASALGLATPAAGPAETLGSVKPACADITDASAFFSSTGTEVSGGITGLDRASCKSVPYAMIVYGFDSTNNGSSIPSQTFRGDNTNSPSGALVIT